MNVTRSIVYGVVGPCKTESSQKPVPVHPLMADTLTEWREHCAYTKPDDWVFAGRRHRGRRPYWGQAILRNMFARLRNALEFRNASAGTPSVIPIRLY